MKEQKRELDMYKIEEIVRDLLQDVSIKQIARTQKISKNTVKRYRDILNEIKKHHQIDDGGNLEPIMEVFRRKRKEERYSENFGWLSQKQENLKELFANCKNHILIFEEIRRSGFVGSYSSLMRYIEKNNLNPQRPVLRMETKPGEIAQIDFGYVGRIYDPNVKKMVKAYVFVMVLSYSRDAYYEIVTSQDTTTWCNCHIHAFEHFGGVPKEMVPDNLKSAIIKASFFDPIPNRTYADLAMHYGFQISPCKPAKPEHKGKVESGVKYAKNNFLPLRTFKDIADSNCQLKEWNSTKAQVRIHGTTRQRPLDLFLLHEKDALVPLPIECFEIPVYKELTVYNDHHIQFNNAYYSAPYELRKQKVIARKTQTTLCIFHENKLVAVHIPTSKGQRRTNEAHYPPNMFKYMQYDSDYCLKKAKEIGSNLFALIKFLLEENPIKNLRGAQNIIRLEEKYTGARLELAAARAILYGNYTYYGVKQILEKKLENEGNLFEEKPVKKLNDDYARDLSEILQKAVS